MTTSCHSERSEESLLNNSQGILRFAQDDRRKKVKPNQEVHYGHANVLFVSSPGCHRRLSTNAAAEGSSFYRQPRRLVRPPDRGRRAKDHQARTERADAGMRDLDVLSGRLHPAHQLGHVFRRQVRPARPGGRSGVDQADRDQQKCDRTHESLTEPMFPN